MPGPTPGVRVTTCTCEADLSAVSRRPPGRRVVPSWEQGWEGDVGVSGGWEVMVMIMMPDTNCLLRAPQGSGP